MIFYNLYLTYYQINMLPAIGGTKSHFSNMTKPLILKGFIHFNEKM